MLGFSPLAGAPLASAGDANTRTLILAATEAQDIAAFAVNSSFGLILDATEAKDVASVILELGSELSLAATEAPDVSVIVVHNIDAVLAGVEAQDVASFIFAMSGTLSMAATETPDSYSQNAYILWLEPTEPDDPSIWVPKNDPAPYLTTVI